MMTVAVTGGSGFIGASFLQAARGRFDIRVLPRYRGGGGSEGVDLSDSTALAAALAGCDALVHCAHNGANEEENTAWGIALMRACDTAGVKRVVAMGSFATYDNGGNVINENTRSCNARIPYVVGKLRLQHALERGVERLKAVRLVLLEPTIVVGAGGSWDRFARHLARAETLFLPNGGRAICNTVEVGLVAEAICRSLELPASSFGSKRMIKSLISGAEPMSWAEWLGKEHGVDSSRIQACNGNRWAENGKRNFMLQVRYSSLGDQMFTLRRSLRRSGVAATREPGQAAESPTLICYVPEGLDRLTLSCQAFASTAHARSLGLV